MMVFEFHSGRPVRMYHADDFSRIREVEAEIHNDLVKPVDGIHPWLFVSPKWFQMIALMGQITEGQPVDRDNHGLIFVYERGEEMVCDQYSTVDWDLEVFSPIYDMFWYTCTKVCRNEDEYESTRMAWGLD